MRRAVPLLVPTVLFIAAACNGDDDDSIQTLPPIRTTTTSSTTTTTVSEEVQYYTIQPGETLGIIAERMGVTINDIVEINGIEDPEYIQAGQRIQIPPGATMIATTAPESG